MVGVVWDEGHWLLGYWLVGHCLSKLHDRHRLVEVEALRTECVCCLWNGVEQIMIRDYLLDLIEEDRLL